MTTPQVIQDLVAPLRQELEKIDAQIRQTEDDLKALRELRQPIVRMLNVADPDPSKKKPGPKKTTKPGDRVAADTLDAAYAWLVANFDGQDITAAAIKADPSFTFVGPPRINDVLAALADRGVIRLDHVGGTRGRQKFYKVVRDAQS